MEEDYVVEIGKKEQKSILQTFQDEFSEAEADLHRTELEMAKIKAQQILNEAELESQKILEEAKTSSNQTLNEAKIEAKEIVEKAINEAQQTAQQKAEEIISDAQKEKDELINASKEEIENQRVETINNAYKEGYEDGHKKLLEELEEKIKFFDDFCASQYQIEQNILKAASREVLDIILTISRKILLKEIDGEVLDKIIKNSISLLENKENINIILSEKYAKILYEFQKKSLNEEISFDFQDFKQYQNFNISYNPEYDDDTIIVENIKERLDASISSQIEIVIREIEEKTQKDKLEIEEYKQIHEID